MLDFERFGDLVIGMEQQSEDSYESNRNCINTETLVDECFSWNKAKDGNHPNHNISSGYDEDFNVSLEEGLLNLPKGMILVSIWHMYIHILS
jgi:hypothetical protein